jgi:hypothetical protein
MRLKTIAVLAVTAAFLGIGVPAASATFHLMKIREIYPGSVSQPKAEYVELQMWAPDQNLVKGQLLTTFGPTGTLTKINTFPANVAGKADQSTLVLATPAAATQFGITADATMAEVDQLNPAGGAVCWEDIDCVSWGNFSGNFPNTPAGTPAPAIPDGMALRRTIAPGCQTALDPGDDHDDSAADFLAVAPAPRPNSVPPSERVCAPDTVINDKPALNTSSTEAEFTYEAPHATSYECRLDTPAFSPCRNEGPQIYAGLLDGTHTFEVRGVNVIGPDLTPASYTWTVDTVAPTATIDSHPADPSLGASATFTFHAGEQTSKIECSMTAAGEPDAFSSCASGKTYLGLADGVHTFKVRATDLAGNLQTTPTAFSWTVDHTTPPQTTIVSKPPDPSTSLSASFTYESNVPGSSFECRLDAAAFAPCPAGGIAYAGLANGLHTFGVRAIDPTSNVDPTPAAYSFSVQVAATPPPTVPPPTVGPPTPVSFPQTILSPKPAKKSADTTPTFRFRADSPGASFQCAVDGGRFKACHSPFTTPKLKPGVHTFSVRSVLGGLTDPTPAKFTFQILAR